MQPIRIALLLGHRDATMVEGVYGVMDAQSLAGDIAGVFNNMDLPEVEVSNQSLRGEWDKNGITKKPPTANMARMAKLNPKPKKSKAPLSAG